MNTTASKLSPPIKFLTLMKMTDKDFLLSEIPEVWKGKIKTRHDLKERIKYENDGKLLVLRLPNEYPIESSRINTKSKLLAWVSHLARKPWITSEAIGVLIQVVGKKNHFKPVRL
jgi:hypothetical protein